MTRRLVPIRPVSPFGDRARALSLLLWGLSLISGGPACRREAPPSVPVAEGGQLTLDAVAAMLYRCEALAAQGEVAGFRSCLTPESGALLEQSFAETSAAITAALAAREPTAIVHPARRSLEELRQQASWEGQLRHIARTPRSPIRDLKQSGDRATFRKVTDDESSLHYLRRSHGRWTIDLEANPALVRRLEQLRNHVAKVAQELALEP